MSSAKDEIESLVGRYHNKEIDKQALKFALAGLVSETSSKDVQLDDDARLALEKLRRL